MNYMLEAKKTAGQKAYAREIAGIKRNVAIEKAANKLNANKKKAYIGSGIAGAGAVAGGASAAVLAKKAKQYAAAAAKEKDPRAKKIYEAKAAKYKKLAIAAGASSGAIGAAAAGTADAAAASGKIAGYANTKKKEHIDAANKLKAFKESYADGYYAALCEIEALEESYDDYDEYDEYDY